MKILEQSKIGNLVLKNRVVMAPMTRSRADEDGIINASAAKYYAQRASAGLIISEAINISEQAVGMPATPGLFTKEQIDAWKNITQAVHKADGKIIAQLNHSGRVAHTLNRKGLKAVAPSPIAIIGQKAYTPQGQMDYEVPLELTVDEIRKIIADFKTAAANAIEAGFDGVELHSAVGYLPNQFLMSSSNQRKDHYGGSIENRSRFVIEVMQELIATVGEGKVGIKLSPSAPINNMFDENPNDLYTYLIKELDKLPIAYIQLMQALSMFPLDEFPHFSKNPIEDFGHLTDKPIITNGGYSKDSAEAIVEAGKAQFVSFGTLYLANPDLPQRFALNADLNEPDRATMYGGGGEKGYTDYPSL